MTKFIGLIYLDSFLWKSLSAQARQHLLEEWVAFEEELQHSGQRLANAPQPFPFTKDSVTVRYFQGQAIVSSDDILIVPNQMSGVVFVEARDMNHAISLLSHHPGIKQGAIEIRTLDHELFVD